jgi:tetratricopeptide (TPR) repeat protein
MTATVRHVALLSALFATVVGLHIVQAQSGADSGARRAESLLYVQSPTFARQAALSYDSVLADLYWIRAVQYYGRTKLAAGETKRYDLLYPLLDFTTTLDPHFDVAYRFGGIFLAEPAPGGAGRPDQAIALLEKGLRAQPDKWQFVGDIGFVNYFWLKNYEQAAEWFRRASELPNGPEWMAALAATVLNEGGNRASSRRLWEDILQGDNPPYLRDRARRALMQLDAIDQLAALRRITAAYHQRTGHTPTSWRDLGAAGYLRQIPQDPTGTPYEIDPATGEVRLTADSILLPLPKTERPE